MDEKLQPNGKDAMCGRHISFLYRKSGTHLTLELKRLGLSSIQSIVLVGIFRYEGVNQQTLAQIISVDPGVASRILRELEDRELIEKKRDEQNRRNLNLYLTLDGRKLAEESLSIQGTYWEGLLRGFTPEEVATLNRLLAQMELRAYANPD